MNEHVLTPWTVQTDGKGFFWIDRITNSGGVSICNCGDERDIRAEANATFIVRACNAHNELVYCLKSIIDDLPSGRAWLNPDIERMARNLIKEGA